MTILDDELLQKIRLSSECQASAKQYRTSLILELIWKGVASTVIGIIVITIVWITFNSIFNQGDFNPLILGSFAFFVYFFAKTSIKFLNILLDLFNNKLDISQDVFLSLSLEQDDSYSIILKDAGSLPIIRDRLKKFKKNTAVYVIRAGYSKTLLDLIPIDTV